VNQILTGYEAVCL